MRRALSLKAGLACLLALTALPRVSGQVFTTSLTGVVADSTGAVVPGAAVELTNVDTQEVRRTETGESGRYTFSQLLPGTYELNVGAEGFKRFLQAGVALRSSIPGEVNVTLEVGAVTETVEVSAMAPLLETQSADRTVTLSADQVSALPLNTRSPFAHVHTTAGVTAVRTGISQSYLDQNQSRFAMNGGRDMSGLVMVDGAPAASADWGGLIASPSVDSVQEVQLVRNAYDVEYARTGSGVVSVVTKGGSSEFHGRIFEFFRNDNLDANSWANNQNGSPRGELKRNQFGANISGPIWRDKRLFLFFGYEGLRQPSPSSTTTTVPTPRERQGDFSQTFNSDGTLQQIFDPFSTKPNPNGAGFIRDPFPNNVIPSTRFDAVGRNVLNLYPEPNVPGVAVTNANNFFSQASAEQTNDRYDARVDWARTDTHTLYGRFSVGRPERVAARFFGGGADTGNEGREPRHLVTIGNTFVPNPSWVVNLLLTSGRWREEQIPLAVADGSDMTSLGLPGSFADQLGTRNIGQWSIQNYSGLGLSRLLNAIRETHSLSVNATKELDRHSLKFGFQGEIARLNSGTAESAHFSFSRGMTAGPVAAVSSAQTGNAVASLLLGAGSDGRVPYVVQPAVQHPYYAWYFQDSWRVNGRLTLNTGLRYELQRPRTERYNRLNYFDFDVQSPLSDETGLDLLGGLVFTDEDNRQQLRADNSDLAPRIGFAYKLTDKLVMRGGYGISYTRALGSVSGTDGFSTDTPWVHSVGNDGLNPLNLVSNPYPQGIDQPTGASLGLLTQVGANVTAVHYDNPTSYVQNYSFDLQYQLSPGSLVEVGYSGNVGRKLWYGVGRNLNQLHPMFLSLGEGLNTQVDNPFFGAIASGPLSGRTVPRHRLLRPYPQFVNVNSNTEIKGATSSFNALFAKYTLRLNEGLTVLSSYQWSRALDDASEDQGWGVDEAFRDIYNGDLDYSVSAHDMPHSFVTSLIYELPVGRGKKYGADLPKALDFVIGGWEVATVLRFNSQLPHKLSAPNTLSAYGFAWQHPNISDRSLLDPDDRTPERWFDTSVISAPGTFDIGNAPRYINEVRNAPQRFADLTVFKNFRINERFNTEFRAEFFNVTNTPQFARPQGGCGSFCQFGSGSFAVMPSTQYVGARQVQLGLKLDF